MMKNVEIGRQIKRKGGTERKQEEMRRKCRNKWWNRQEDEVCVSSGTGCVERESERERESGKRRKRGTEKERKKCWDGGRERSGASFCFDQGILTAGESSVQLTSLYLLG
jgi:hypothetical protein